MARTTYYIKNGTYARQDLAKMIESKRRVLGFKLKDLAEAIGISDRYISQKIQQGDFTHEQLFILFDKLDFSTSEILLVFGHKKKVETETDIMKKLLDIEKAVSKIKTE